MVDLILLVMWGALVFSAACFVTFFVLAVVSKASAGRECHRQHSQLMHPRYKLEDREKSDEPE